MPIPIIAIAGVVATGAVAVRAAHAKGKNEGYSQAIEENAVYISELNKDLIALRNISKGLEVELSSFSELKKDLSDLKEKQDKIKNVFLSILEDKNSDSYNIESIQEKLDSINSIVLDGDGE